MNRTHASPSVRSLLVALLLAVAAVLPGCAAPGFFFGPDADPASAETFAPLAYPKEAPIGEHLDIVAYKEWNNLTLTNRTTRAFSKAQVWINQQYVCVVESIPVGERTTLSLSKFINEHGEAFPVGGLLNPERSYRLVLAEIYEPATGSPRYRILVRTDEVLPGQ